MSLNYRNKSFNNSELSGVMSHLNIHMTGVTMTYRGRVTPLNVKTDSTVTVVRHVGSIWCCCLQLLFILSSLFHIYVADLTGWTQKNSLAPVETKCQSTCPRVSHKYRITSNGINQKLLHGYLNVKRWCYKTGTVQMINMPHNIQISHWRTNYGEMSPADGRIQPMKSSKGVLQPSRRKKQIH